MYLISPEFIDSRGETFSSGSYVLEDEALSGLPGFDRICHSLWALWYSSKRLFSIMDVYWLMMMIYFTF